MRELGAHRRVQFILLMGIYFAVVSLGVLGVVFLSQGKLDATRAVVGTGGFVGLVELMRRVTREWVTADLPLRAAQGATDEQLNQFIERILTAQTTEKD